MKDYAQEAFTIAQEITLKEKFKYARFVGIGIRTIWRLWRGLTIIHLVQARV